MKKTIVRAIICLLVVGSFVPITFKVIEYKNTKEYGNKIRDVSDDIYSASILPYYLCGKVADALKASNPTDNLSESIDSLQESWSARYDIMENEKSKIDIKMKTFKSPPKKYVKAYSYLQKEYEEYNTLYDLSINPTGTYASYLNDCYNHKINLFSYENTTADLLP